MGFERSLLERLRSGQVRPVDEFEFDANTLLRSVCRNVERVLNTWAGSALIDPELGLQDDLYRQQDTERIARRVAERIETCIQRYEPRLRRVAASAPARSAEEAGERWVFPVEAQLVTAPGRPIATFEVVRDKWGYRVVP